MNINDFDNIFKDNSLFKKNNSKLFNDLDNEQDVLKEEHLSFKLSLRKQKLQEKIYSKRNFNQKEPIYNFFQNLEKKDYTQEDIKNGKIYDDLKNVYNKKNEKELRNTIYSISIFFSGKEFDFLEFKKYLSNNDNNDNLINNEDDIKNKIKSLPLLILEIAFNTQDKTIYIFSFNLLLNFTYISHDFCTKITNEQNIKIMFNKLIFFYPFFAEEKNNNKIYDINDKNEAYYFGSQILKLLGNLFLSSDSYEPFEANNFYEKIFYLLSEFDLDSKDKKFICFRYDYLDTLIWLISIFLDEIKNFGIIYSDKVINIIPNLLNFIRGFYFTKETDVLSNIIKLIYQLSEINDDIKLKIVDSEGIKNITNLFRYLFNNGQNDDEIILTPEITLQILYIFINIFELDSKYLYNIDYSEFAVVLKELFSIYKMHHSNHYDIQSNLLILLSNLACFDDIEEIIIKILMNNNIIKYVFNYYNKYHKLDVLIFMDNIMIKQHKKVRDFILNMGGFEIIKNNICIYNGDCINLIEKSITVLYNLIKAEKAFNIRLLFEKLYKTSIPDKLKEIDSNIDLTKEKEILIKSIISDCEIYEKSLED